MDKLHGICVLFLGLYCVIRGQEDDGVCKQNDPGTLSSCFNPDVGETRFEINWFPQNITGNQSYHFRLMKLVAPEMNFENGSAHLTVWIPGLPHEKPLYNKTTPFSCHDITKGLPEFIGKMFCPFKGGYDVTKPVDFPINITSPPEIPIPKGSYHVRAEVYEKPEPKPGDPILLCVDGWLIFADVTNGYADCHQPEATSVNEFIKALFNKKDNSIGVDKL